MRTIHLLDTAQQQFLYVVTASSLAAALYFHLVLGYRPPWFESTPLELLTESPVLWPLIPALLAFSVAAIIAFKSTRTASYISIVASITALAYSLLQLLGSAIFLFITLVLPSGYIAIGLPTLLVLLVLSYDVQVLRGSETLTPLRWLTSKDWWSIPFKGILATIAMFSAVYIVVVVSQRNPTFEHYSMSWQDSSNSRCANEVTLEFNSAPAYHVWTCSPELLTYLNNSNKRELDVEFKVTYRLGSWEYQVVRVADLATSAHMEGLGWSCSSDDTECASRPPIRQPYTLK